VTLGDIVRWKSQAGGYATEKQGEIVCVVGAGEFVPEPFVNGLDGPGNPRREESYVVRVGRSRLMWPRTKHLRLVGRKP